MQFAAAPVPWGRRALGDQLAQCRIVLPLPCVGAGGRADGQSSAADPWANLCAPASACVPGDGGTRGSSARTWASTPPEFRRILNVGKLCGLRPACLRVGDISPVDQIVRGGDRRFRAAVPLHHGHFALDVGIKGVVGSSSSALASATRSSRRPGVILFSALSAPLRETIFLTYLTAFSILPM